MPAAPEELQKPVLIGRSSSHFTRVTRIFAADLQVEHAFRVVPDLLSTNVEDYGGNPALRMPSLQTHKGIWFGALNICRELFRLSSSRLRIVWPEDHVDPRLANAQELTVSAMSTEVSLILSKIGLSKIGGTGASGQAESAHQAKMRTSLLGSMSWLEDNVTDVLRALPADRDSSFLEVTLFCLVAHLEFRDVLPLAPYPNLTTFSHDFANRPSAHATPFRFD